MFTSSYLQTQAEVALLQVALLVHFALVQAVQVDFLTVFLTGVFPSANTVPQASNAIAILNAIFFMLYVFYF